MTRLSDSLNALDLPFLLRVQAGFVPGTQVRVRFSATEIGITPETVWTLPGNYSFQDAPSEFYLSSDNAADVGQFYIMELLDADHKEAFRIVELNGQNGVLVPNGPYLRCNCIVNISDDNNPSAGDVYLGTEPNPVGGVPNLVNTVNHAPANRQRCSTTAYTVPARHVGFIFQTISSASKGREARFELFARPDGKTFTGEIGRTLFETSVDLDLPFYRFDEKTDLEVRGSTDLATANSSAGYHILVMNKESIKTIVRSPITDIG